MWTIQSVCQMIALMDINYIPFPSLWCGNVAMYTREFSTSQAKPKTGRCICWFGGSRFCFRLISLNGIIEHAKVYVVIKLTLHDGVLLHCVLIHRIQIHIRTKDHLPTSLRYKKHIPAVQLHLLSNLDLYQQIRAITCKARCIPQVINVASSLYQLSTFNFIAYRDLWKGIWNIKWKVKWNQPKHLRQLWSINYLLHLSLTIKRDSTRRLGSWRCSHHLCWWTEESCSHFPSKRRMEIDTSIKQGNLAQRGFAHLLKPLARNKSEWWHEAATIKELVADIKHVNLQLVIKEKSVWMC